MLSPILLLLKKLEALYATVLFSPISMQIVLQLTSSIYVVGKFLILANVNQLCTSIFAH